MLAVAITDVEDPETIQQVFKHFRQFELCVYHFKRESPLICRYRRPVCFVSGLRRKRNYGFTRSTRPITAHEGTAICKSQSGAIIENPGNTRGAEQAFGHLFADGLYLDLGRLRRRLWLTCLMETRFYSNGNRVVRSMGTGMSNPAHWNIRHHWNTCMTWMDSFSLAI